MKKYIKVILFASIVFLIFMCNNSFAATSKINSIDVNDINLNSIDSSKIDDLRETLEDIDFSSLDSSAVVDNVNKSEIASGNLNSVDTGAINMDEVIGIYDKLSEVISNEEIADLIQDNHELLQEAGVSSSAISTAETMLRTFDADAVIDIAQNDLDLDKLLEMYRNGASIEEILQSILTDTSLQTKIGIVSKLLFSNFYFRVCFVVLIFIALYSIFITGIIFQKAGRHAFATIIPIYRDVTHLKVCGLSPWLLLLVFIPILGWLMLLAVAIIGRFELAKKFDHGFFFGLGLLFFPIIFRSVIAFSNDEYIEDVEE